MGHAAIDIGAHYMGHEGRRRTGIDKPGPGKWNGAEPAKVRRVNKPGDNKLPYTNKVTGTFGTQTSDLLDDRYLIHQDDKHVSQMCAARTWIGGQSMEGLKIIKK